MKITFITCMNNIHSLDNYKRAKNKLKQFEPHLIELDKFSNYLFNNLHLPGTFDILKEVESLKIEYYIEISELKRIVNSKGRR